MKLQEWYFGYRKATSSQYQEGKYEYAEHIHYFLEVLCVLDGEIEVTVNGKTETAKRGDLAVILPFQPHGYHTPDYCKLWLGIIPPTWLPDFFSTDKFYYTAKKSVFTPSPAVFAYIREKTPPPHWKKEETISPDLFRQIKTLYYVVFEEYFAKVSLNSANLKTNAISSVYMYIYDHYQENLTLKKVAAEVGYSPNYISSCLSVIPNANFRTILNSARVEHAKELLTSTDMKIVDIAFDSGFLSENVFYGIFEKLVGMTPRRYRLSKRSDGISAP